MKNIHRHAVIISVFAGLALSRGLDAQTPAPPPPAPPPPPTVRLPDIDVVGSTPLLGSGVNRDQVPAQTYVLTPGDIQRTGIPDLTGTLNTNIPSINLNDSSGNPFQPDVLFRGFLASPVEGEAEGLAVYVNGARFNDPFGDTVNWDLIPSQAIDRVNVEGSNPVYGLNALGGSIAVKLKNGFTYHGGELTGYGGSFGRAAALFQYGAESQNTSAYVTGDFIQDNGWRYTSQSQLRQIYADLGWRGPLAEAHFSILGADNDLQNPGATPVQILAVNRAQQYTAPNVVRNKYLQLNLNGSYDISDLTSVQGLAYYSNLSQRLINGVTVDFEQCADGSGFLCTEDGDYYTDRAGNPIPDYLNGGPYSGNNFQGTDTNAFGAGIQVSDHHDVFGLPNHLVVGASVDAGDTLFDGHEELGGIDPNLFFLGPGITIDQADLSIAPVRLATTNRYYGLFFTDLLNVTPRLSLSLSGRFNNADISLHDKLGTALNGGHAYNRFNPGVGLTYKVLPGLSAFVSYSEANRAPTPTELSCASITSPCQLPNFFLGDPNLKQVVAHTVELGVRGRLPSVWGGKLVWNVDYFHTNSDDDIIFESSLVQGLDFFQNVGLTRRQGIEANLNYARGPLSLTLGYAYTDATFQVPLTLDSPTNPGADANGQIHVVPGDHLPGIPTHRLKFVVNYGVTPRWTIGASGVLATGQYFFGDEANLNKKLGGYVVLNLNTSYRVTDHIQLFGLITNTFNAKYETYGTYGPLNPFPVSFIPGGAITDARVESPAPPIAGYGGVRVTF